MLQNVTVKDGFISESNPDKCNSLLSVNVNTVLVAVGNHERVNEPKGILRVVEGGSNEGEVVVH